MVSESELLDIMYDYSIQCDAAKEKLMDKLRPFIARGHLPNVQIIMDDFLNKNDLNTKAFSGKIFHVLTTNQRKEKIRSNRLEQVLHEKKAIVFTFVQTKYINDIFRKVPIIDQQKFLTICGDIVVNEGSGELTKRLRSYFRRRIKHQNLAFF